MVDHQQHHMAIGEHSPREIVKFVIVLASILVISIALTSAQGPFSWGEFSRWFMGVFFVVFAGFKLIGYRMFGAMFAGYDIVAKRYKTYAYAYPFIELGLGVLYLFDLLPGVRDVATLTIMSIGTIGVAQEIRKRSGVHCACLGNVIKLPLSTVSLIEDTGMGLMALGMLLS